jgi:FtsP/CotA-like multicopper oxidase with cupredoxin domain
MPDVTRRKLIMASVPLVSGAALLHANVPHEHPWDGSAQAATGTEHAGHGSGGDVGGHANFRDGRTVDHRANGFDPHDILRDFDWGTTRRLASGGVLREWELVAVDKEIEVAPGVRFAAWTYNGRIPGPTLRCREGDRLRITFVNGSAHPHTIHFHGIHPTASPASGRARSSPAAGRSTSSRRCRRACTSTTATCGRSRSTSPRASTAPSSSTRRRSARRPTRW